jgi:hypothetical protein
MHGLTLADPFSTTPRALELLLLLLLLLNPESESVSGAIARL